MRLAAQLLERAARATPTTAEDRGTGWWIRHADGDAWWAGAVLAHGAPDDGRLVERIEAVERFYAERGAAARFQICPGCPPRLDGVLADRGYQWDCPVSLQTLDVAEPVEALSAPGLEVRVRDLPAVS